MAIVTLELETRSPIWTGDAYGFAHQEVHESGLLGSMRWWYEALVRGVGGTICNAPNQGCNPKAELLQGELPIDPRLRRAALLKAGLCDVCQLFGATGWRRRFRLEVDDSRMAASAKWVDTIEVESRKYDKSQRDGSLKSEPPKWYFKQGAREGEFSLHLVPFGPDVTGVVVGLLQFMTDWGGIGARAQHGMGVVRIKPRQPAQALYDQLARIYDPQRAAANAGQPLPSLTNMFMAKLRVDSLDPATMGEIRYDLRALLRTGRESDAYRHDLMGVANKGLRIGSKIKVAGPYNPETPTVRVWGWAPHGRDREPALKKFYEKLNAAKYTGDDSLLWREWNSTRDTRIAIADPLAFAADLMGVTA